MINKKGILLCSLVLLPLLLLMGCSAQMGNSAGSTTASDVSPKISAAIKSSGEGEMANESQQAKTDAAHLTVDSTISDVISNPLFAGFGKFILPLERSYEDDMPLSKVSTLLPYHNNINPQAAVDVINHMVDEVASGNKIFYPICEDAQMQAHTGLFFFRGEPNAPFAIICAGGGFSYVGSIHEGFPLAIELTKKGYNAFVIQYRTGGADVACEDLAAAISFIFANADELQVNTDGYSLWGGSAGARMAAYLGSYGPKAYGGDDLPRPAAVVMQYTGHSDYTKNDPPTYAVIGENDGIASPSVMEQRVDALRAAGIDAEFHLYPNLGHGFGLGEGTSAQGWVEDALAFWEKYISK